MNTLQLTRSLESRAKASAATRSLIDREAAVGNDNTLWVTIGSHMSGTAYRYTQSDNPIELFEWDMHDIWYQFVQAAKNIDADHPAQDRLTRFIVWAREFGPLTRTRKRSQIWQLEEAEDDGKKEGKGDVKEGGNPEMVVQEAMTTDGRIWIDLPFLVQDMRCAWNEAMDLSVPTAHRHNLAAAIARLAGLGVRDDALSGCGLHVMCETLETPRQLIVAVSESGTKQVSLTVMQLLPAAKAWLLYAGHKLLRLSDKSYDGSAWSGEASTPGELARSAGVDSAGFSRTRYLFWKKRLEELSQCDEEQVKKEALQASIIIDQTLKGIEDPQLVPQFS